ncbi:hypothetical protein AGDE_04513 [Angomonas deanei]|uniref:Uncharacterized protein n=1 Tax=Angomonas deanei TaxID=59799 RepID=S9WTP9_9TRYP|nr:hypothetical protein AGDE_04883 [Angomonas deanei]EPY39415.1 hypothetical protein AGDE_04513 [Angomonas deanei]CAD2221428.1 hypothetical protein, conserved [Angomonas deanei]|eukprot:EPY39046.1 hypothetical protein AGDE_04883 [Angomonas deanei]
MSGAASAAATEVAKKSTNGLQKYLVDPIVRTANKIESRSASKMAANPVAQAYLSQYAASGQDAAAASTARFITEQKALLSYRVVRLFEESRYVFSGAHFKNYNLAKGLDDLRFLTTLLFVFIIFVIFGRQTVYPPIRPDSPFALALQHKTNPNY